MSLSDIQKYGRLQKVSCLLTNYFALLTFPLPSVLFLAHTHTPTPLVSECTHTPASFSASLPVCVYSVDFLHQQHNF